MSKLCLANIAILYEQMKNRRFPLRHCHGVRHQQSKQILCSSELTGAVIIVIAGRVSNPGRGKKFFSSPKFRTGSGARIACCSVGIGILSRYKAAGGVKLSTHIWGWIRMNGVTPLLLQYDFLARKGEILPVCKRMEIRRRWSTGKDGQTRTSVSNKFHISAENE